MEEIGRGDFGVVYRGLYHGRSVAIKEFNRANIDNDEVENLERELLTGRYRLDHVNILPIIAALIYPTPNLIIPYIAGGDLSRKLGNNVPTTTESFSVQKRLRVALGVARGLIFMHAKDVLHLDLKSSNILLDGEECTPKICDFGTARIIGENQTYVLSIRFNSSKGYSDPQNMHGGFVRESDVFSFGMICLELVTGLKIHSSERQEGHTNVYLKSFERAIEDGNEIDIVQGFNEGFRDGCSDQNQLRLAQTIQSACKIVRYKRRTMAEIELILAPIEKDLSGHVASIAETL